MSILNSWILKYCNHQALSCRSIVLYSSFQWHRRIVKYFAYSKKSKRNVTSRSSIYIFSSLLLCTWVECQFYIGKVRQSVSAINSSVYHLCCKHLHECSSLQDTSVRWLADLDSLGARHLLGAWHRLVFFFLILVFGTYIHITVDLWYNAVLVT